MCLKPLYTAGNAALLTIIFFIYAFYVSSKLLANLSDSLEKILLKEEI